MRRAPGGVPERPKGTGCKPVGSAYGGSNPPAPIIGTPAARRRLPMRGPTKALASSGMARRLRPAPIVSLLLIAVASAGARAAAALTIPAPLYFPDEWLYAAISRSVVHGPFRVVHGSKIPVASTISYVGPILTSPLWLMRNVTVVYHLSQATAAVAFASSAFVVYAIARRLGARRESSLVAALLSQLVPMGALTATLLAEPYSYPVLLLCVLLALDALATPSPLRIAGLLGSTVLLCFTGGLQFLIVPAAFVVAWCTAAPTNATRVKRGAGLAAIAVLGAVLLLSPPFEGSALSVHLRAAVQGQRYPVGSISAWLGTNVFVLAVASGWIIVPLAATQLARLACASDARSRVFAHITIAVTAGSLVEAAIWGANGNGVYERFTFYASPLLAVAFCLGIEHPDGKRRPATAGLAYLAALGALLVPLTNRLTENLGHSPTALGLTNGLIFAGGAPPLFWAPLLAVLAVIAAAAGSDRPHLLAVGAAAVLVTTSVAGFRDIDQRSHFRAPIAPPTSRAALLVSSSQPDYMINGMQTLFWNPGINRVVSLGGSDSPDGLGAIAGRLRTRPAIVDDESRSVPGPFVVAPNTTVWGAGRVDGASDGTRTLAHAPTTVAFGWYADGHLASFGRLFAAADARRAVRLRLHLEEVARHSSQMSVRCSSSNDQRSIEVPPHGADLVIVVRAGSVANCAWAIGAGSGVGRGDHSVSLRATLARRVVAGPSAG